MIFGVLCGLSAAVLNSIGYIFGSRFLLHYKSAPRMTVAATLVYDGDLPAFPGDSVPVWKTA